MASQNPQTPTNSIDDRKPAKCCSLMLGPYIYDTDSVQEHLLCRAEANSTAPESAENTPDIMGQEAGGDLELQDLDAMMQEHSSPKSRL